MSGGGGGTTISRTEPPEYVQPYTLEMLDRVGDLANPNRTQPAWYDTYRYLSDAQKSSWLDSRLSPFNDFHNDALQMIEERVARGDPVMDTARHIAKATNQGDFLKSSPAFALNRHIGFGKETGDEYGIFDANASLANAAGNPLLGLNNPALNQAISGAQQDVTQNYTNTVRPELERQARISGAFGNSGVQQMQEQARDDYLENLGDISTDMRYQNYGLQSNLYEQDAARRTQNSQFNAAQMTGNSQANADREYQTWLSKMGALQGAIQGQADAWGGERENQMRTLSMAPELSDYRYNEAKQLLGIGDVVRQQDQMGKDLLYQNWQERQQWPYKQVDLLSNAIRTAMGGGGTSTMSAPGSSQMANLVGGGLMGYGVGQEFDSPYAGAIGGGLMGLWGG